jgi:type II secretory pathway pseudopilin PulG
MQMKPKIALVYERGITLLEAIVALALVSLVVGAAVVSVGGFMAQKTLTGWSDSIVNDIRSAQQLGIARRAPAIVVFTNGTPPSYATTIGSITVRSQTLPSELTVTSATIQFNTLGIPGSGTTLTLTDTRNGQTVTISVAPVTGAVTVQ